MKQINLLEIIRITNMMSTGVFTLEPMYSITLNRELPVNVSNNMWLSSHLGVDSDVNLYLHHFLKYSIKFMKNERGSYASE